MRSLPINQLDSRPDAALHLLAAASHTSSVPEHGTYFCLADEVWLTCCVIHAMLSGPLQTCPQGPLWLEPPVFMHALPISKSGMTHVVDAHAAGLQGQMAAARTGRHPPAAVAGKAQMVPWAMQCQRLQQGMAWPHLPAFRKLRARLPASRLPSMAAPALQPSRYGLEPLSCICLRMGHVSGF